jgi:cytosine/adenosine deaminase-related metal-dependent hydrolase
MADCERVVNDFHDPSPFSMTRIALAPCSPFSVTEELLKETITWARKKELRCHTHLAETIDEENYCREMFNKRPLEYMESVGWIGNDVWFAHSIHLSDGEIKKMGATGCGVAHCPNSNLRLGSGIAKVPFMLENNVPVGLGVDGSASNDSSDMIGELRLALLVHRVKSGILSMPTESVLRMATTGGAKVLGWEKETGSLEEGKAADIIMMDLKKLGYAGAMHDPVAALIYSGDSHIVDTSIVNGEIVVRDGKLVHINEEELYEKANKIAYDQLKRASDKTGIDYYKKITSKL